MNQSIRTGKGSVGSGRVVPLGGTGDAGFSVRAMPESLAAEAAVLGSMIVEPGCIGDVVELLKAEAFYRIENRHLFNALISLYENNKGDGLDAVLLRDELERRGQLEQIGGVDYIATVAETVPSSANVS